LNQSPQSSSPDTGSSPWRRYLQAGILPRAAVILVGVPCLFIITARGGMYFLLLVSLIIALGLREFYELLVAKGYRPYRVLGLICGLGVCWYVYQGGVAVPLLLTMTLLAIMVRELFRREKVQSLNHIAVTMLGVFYVAWLGSHLVMLRELPAVAGVRDEVGARLVFFVALVTWIGDTFAYLVGIAVGRRPLLLRVSPKKTVEGAVGGLVGSAGTGLVCALTFLPLVTPATGLLLGLAGGICGQLGDLVESMLKRDVGTKDTAELLPGHGGVLDRFDSLLFCGPVLYYYFRFFVV
jgi:phosphatidate cytidylyltransferase